MALKFAVNNSLSAVTSLPTAISTGSMTLLQTQTASSSATIDFTSEIDSTYDSYVFKFIDIHPATDNVNFNVNFRDGGSAYDAVKTTTSFFNHNNEGDSDTGLGYLNSSDIAQGTGFQDLCVAVGSDNDQSCVGYLQLFSPSNTTFVKHFISRSQFYHQADYSHGYFVGGYCNTTTAIDGVRFKMSSGNIESGTIKMYGVA